MTPDPASQPPAETGGAPEFRAPVIVLVLLTLTAGTADGLALSRHDIFVANQSGNVVHIGMGVVGDYASWHLALLSVAGFAVGGMVSWALSSRTRLAGPGLARLRLAVVAGLLACWALGVLVAGPDSGLVAALLGAVSMGVLATVLTRVAGVRAQTTFQSGTVLTGSQGLMAWVTHRDDGTGRRLALVGAVTLTCYAAGGGLGALAAGSDILALLVFVPALAVSFGLARRSPGARRAQTG